MLRHTRALDPQPAALPPPADRRPLARHHHLRQRHLLRPAVLPRRPAAPRAPRVGAHPPGRRGGHAELRRAAGTGARRAGRGRAPAGDEARRGPRARARGLRRARAPGRACRGRGQRCAAPPPHGRQREPARVPHGRVDRVRRRGGRAHGAGAGVVPRRADVGAGGAERGEHDGRDGVGVGRRARAGCRGGAEGAAWRQGRRARVEVERQVHGSVEGGEGGGCRAGSTRGVRCRELNGITRPDKMYNIVY
jgi:hypothetical protein